MSPVLAGLIPLLAILTLALATYIAAGVLAIWGLTQVARGALEPEQEEETE